MRGSIGGGPRSQPSSLAARPAFRPPGPGGCSLFPGPRENQNEVQYEGKYAVEFLVGLSHADIELDCLRLHALVSTIPRCAACLLAPAGHLHARSTSVHPPWLRHPSPPMGPTAAIAPSSSLGQPRQGPSKGALAIAIRGRR